MKLAKILFRCDGSNEIGYRHLRRSLNIAQWMRGKFDVSFCVKKTKEAKDIFKKTGFDVNFIDPSVPETTEIIEVSQIARDWAPKVIVNDVKSTSEDYMKALTDAKARIVNFDDLGKGADLANAVIDANRRENKKKFYGPKYVVLHPDFVKENKKNRSLHKNVKNVLISIGGGDPHHYTQRLLECLAESGRKFNCSVVLGPTFGYTKEIKKAWKGQGWVHFLENLDHLVKPILWADLAIVNGGLTVFETICLGTPTLVVSQNGEEVKNVKRLERKDAVLDGGLGSKLSVNKLNKRLRKICDDFEFRQKLSATGKEIVDGRGIFRVIGIIERFARKR